MARLSLYEILKRKGTLEEVLGKLKENPSVAKAQEVLSCSTAAAANFLAQAGLITTVLPATSAHTIPAPKSSQHDKWIVCAGPLRGIYTRNTPTNEPVEYTGVSLFLGVVNASNEREALNEIRNKLHGSDEKLIDVIAEESLFAWKLA